MAGGLALLLRSAVGQNRNSSLSQRPHDTVADAPYLHDGHCLTLEDTVEFFKLVLELKLTKEEKRDLVAFLRQL